METMPIIELVNNVITTKQLAILLVFYALRVLIYEFKYMQSSFLLHYYFFMIKSIIVEIISSKRPFKRKKGRSLISKCSASHCCGELGCCGSCC